MSKIIIATSNSGKVRELRELLSKIPFCLVGLNECDVEEVAETGSTFVENAELKASSYARQTNCWTIADDSGLEVEILDRAPGVHSARYAGEHSNDEKNIKKLLFELSISEDPARLARFACAISVSDSHGNIQITSEGFCNGKISRTPAGTNGFGYDPVFIPDGFTQTFGELNNEVKRSLSHRSQALKRIIEHLHKIPLSMLDQ